MKENPDRFCHLTKWYILAYIEYWKQAESWLEPAGTRIPDLDHANVGSDCDWIETESGIAHLRGSTFLLSFSLRRCIGGTTLSRLKI